jgi:outer membrane protein assembly factor BamB
VIVVKRVFTSPTFPADKMRLMVKQLLVLLGFFSQFGEASHLWERVVSGTVLEGNGVFLSPSEDRLIVASSNGGVTALEPSSGSIQWEYEPSLPGDPTLTSNSGISFTTFNAPSSYLVYAFTQQRGDDPSQS